MKTFLTSIRNFLFKTKRRTVIVLVIVGIIAISQIRSYLQADYEVRVVDVKRDTFIDTISASGEVKAERYANLVFLSSGDIKDIYVTDGSTVQKGDRIATIDSTIAYQTYLQAEADLRAREASLAVVYDDLKGHDEDESLSQKEERTLAETAKDKAYRAYVAAQKALSNTTIRAPFDGIVQFASNLSIGSYASPASASFVLVDPTTVYFEAEVSEIEVSEIKLDMKSLIQLDAYPDEEYDQRVAMIGITNVTTSTGGTAYTVKVALPTNNDNKFRVGMSGDIDFIVEEATNTLFVPFSSLVDEDGKNYVWVVSGTNNVTKTAVETGNSSVDSVEILSGIKEGDRIVERPPNDMQDGDKVKSI